MASMTMERMGMGMPMMNTGMMNPMSGANTGMAMPPNMMMLPRCTMKMERTKTGMCITCVCDDAMAASMLQNLCTMMSGGMVSCCMMMNGMMVCCCNLVMGMCTMEMTEKGCKMTCMSGDPKCCQMIQSCCDCMTTMMQAGCTCCLMMNQMPICCGTMMA